MKYSAKLTPLDEATSDWLDSFTVYPRLGAEEERELGRRVRQGDKAARAKLIVHNMRLVVHIAQRYTIYGGMPLADLIQEGALGLMKAVEQYRPDAHPEARFGTFAGWLIQQACGRALSERANIIRIPTYLWQLRAKVWAVEAQYDVDLTDAEIARLLNESVSRVHAARTAHDIPLSLSGTISARAHYDKRTRGWDVERDGVEFIETLASDDDVEASVLENVRSDALYAALKQLTDRERTIIRLRYGLGATCDETALSAKAVAKRLHLSADAVRVLEQSALAKLREALLPDELSPLFDIA